jgi:hypothetical protein
MSEEGGRVGRRRVERDRERERERERERSYDYNASTI